MCDPARAIGGIQTSYRLQVGLQLQFTLLANVVVAARSQIQKTAHWLHRICIFFGQCLGHHSPRLDRMSELPKTFFAMSNCSARRPTRRSSSAIRCDWSSSRPGNSNTCGARSRNSCRQRESTVSLIPYSRLAWLRLFLPVINSTTTRTLKSGVYVRRGLPIWTPFLHVTIPLAMCPVFGVHYKSVP